jgi:hypothetical protein
MSCTHSLKAAAACSPFKQILCHALPIGNQSPHDLQYDIGQLGTIQLGLQHPDHGPESLYPLVASLALLLVLNACCYNLLRILIGELLKPKDASEVLDASERKRAQGRT